MGLCGLLDYVLTRPFLVGPATSPVSERHIMPVHVLAPAAAPSTINAKGAGNPGRIVMLLCCCGHESRPCGYYGDPRRALILRPGRSARSGLAPVPIQLHVEATDKDGTTSIQTPSGDLNPTTGSSLVAPCV